MKKALLTVFVFLIPCVLSAAELCLYCGYNPGQMSCSPPAFTTFEMFLYLYNAENYVIAIEYQLATPDDPLHEIFVIESLEYPVNMSGTSGHPFTCHWISYWPPVDGFSTSYNLMVTMCCMLLESCWNDGGPVADYRLVIGPCPGTGEPQPRGLNSDNQYFPIIGQTSILCPFDIATEETSWGVIKSMYKN